MIDNLKRVLGLPALLAVAVGIVVAQSTVISVLQGIGIAGNGFLIAMGCAWVLVAVTNLSFAELSMMLPRAGGLSSYTEIALGHFPAIIAVLSGYVVVSILAVPAELVLFGMVFNHVFTDLITPVQSGLVLLSVLMVLNLVGLDLFAKFQEFFTVVMVVTLVGLGVLGLMAATPATAPTTETPFNPMGWGVLALIPLAMWAFVGAEFVCSLVEETKQPEKNIPRSMLLAILTAFGVYGLFSLGAGRFLSPETLVTSPTPHLNVVESMVGKGGLLWMGFACIAATCSTVNSLLATVPRMLYGMAHAGQVPAFLMKLHPRFQTPWAAIVCLTTAMALPLFYGANQMDKVINLLTAATCSWLIAYIIAHIDVIVLRIRRPDLKRPFKSPLFPLPQIIGVLGMIYALWNNAPDPSMRLIVYRNAGLFLLGTVVYSWFWVKFKMKLGLFSPVSFEQAMRE